MDTKYGEVSVTIGNIGGKSIAYISRHGKAHRDLSNMVNYRAHLLALKRLDTRAIVATTVCGVLDLNIPLAKLAVFDDLYFPDNRLPGGEACTVYDTAGEKSDLASAGSHLGARLAAFCGAAEHASVSLSPPEPRCP